tara:strand:+ start:24506 stop:25303 length:798 start_codon:yes stop_codon:yes gene_type:complete
MINTILNNKTLLRFIGIAIVVFLVLKQCNQISNLKQDLENTEKVADRNFNNYKTAQDSIKIELNKNGELVSKIGTFEYDVEVLKSDKSKLLNRYDKVLKEKTKLENINTLISTDLTIKDSILNSNVIVSQDKDTVTFKFSDNKNWDKYNYREFSGELKLIKLDSMFNVKSSRFDFNQGISLTTAIVKEEGRNILRITTPYPGLDFTSIENINIVNDKLNQKQKKKAGWSIGVGFGYGMNLNNNQVISTGPSIGFGIYYSPSWLKF